MPKTPTQTEIDEAKHLLSEAIYKDGEGGPSLAELHLEEKGYKIHRKTYYEETGKYLWTPKESDFSYWWLGGAFTYGMGTSDGQVRAYHRQGETVVTHNGSERHRLSVRGWY